MNIYLLVESSSRDRVWKQGAEGERWKKEKRKADNTGNWRLSSPLRELATPSCQSPSSTSVALRVILTSITGIIYYRLALTSRREKIMSSFSQPTGTLALVHAQHIRCIRHVCSLLFCSRANNAILSDLKFWSTIWSRALIAIFLIHSEIYILHFINDKGLSCFWRTIFSEKYFVYPKVNSTVKDSGCFMCFMCIVILGLSRRVNDLRGRKYKIIIFSRLHWYASVSEIYYDINRSYRMKIYNLHDLNSFLQRNTINIYIMLWLGYKWRDTQRDVKSLAQTLALLFSRISYP